MLNKEEKRELQMLRRDRDWLVNEIRKMKDLFRQDRHGTVRPKVDILTDLVDKVYVDVANEMGKLRREIGLLKRKIAELEIKK